MFGFKHFGRFQDLLFLLITGYSKGINYKYFNSVVKDCKNHFSRRFDGCTASQIRSYLKLDLLHDANTSMGHGSKISQRKVPGFIK